MGDFILVWRVSRMNLNPTGKWDMLGNISQWWKALAASALTGMDGLGAYMGEERLTLAQVRKNLSGIQLGRWTTFPVDLGNREEMGLVLQKTVSAWALKSCPVSLAVSPHPGFFRQVSIWVNPKLRLFINPWSAKNQRG